MRRIVVVPSTLALLPEYAGIEDPIADLRRAVTDAVAWLPPGPVSILTSDSSPAARRIATALLGDRSDLPQDPDLTGMLVVANGTATRTEKAPGHLDERAAGFDEALRRGLATGDLAALKATDVVLGAELWAPDAAAFVGLAETAGAVSGVQVDYDDAPYGVQYWVVRWTCPS